MFVDHLTTDGLMLHVSNEQPLVNEVISVTAFLPNNDKVRMYIDRYMYCEYVHAFSMFIDCFQSVICLCVMYVLTKPKIALPGMESGPPVKILF